ncbi:phosphotyrosine protein phosphatase [Luteolibacter ambystomatis]|uniref:Phosphotyrosine protein phosphatase n=1 Tax=Luteolibacter ambystomatis TaxID=2824561 RepID=A0A975G7J6_9BACT|nr:phosphotyrosine protein phosphatase [Luteolibacter ambystomatis]QUE50257.1 phosphotyrosine protein phosphatase [Luteolibacter ambystomatis]
MLHVLFICSRNRWRSPTAEAVFADHPGIECASAGLSRDAENRLDSETVKWADLIFVMERHHKAKLSSQFRKELTEKRVVCLGIPDHYPFMDPRLVEILKTKVGKLL